MYTSPDEYGTHDFLCQVGCRYLEACRDECTFKDSDSFTSDKDVNEMCLILMQENGWAKAQCAISGRELYRKLREEMLRLFA